jgi:hypothetical protein
MSIKTFFSELGKDSPVVGLGAAHFAGITLSDLVVILGIAYGVMRLWVISAELYWKYKDRHDGKSK